MQSSDALGARFRPPTEFWNDKMWRAGQPLVMTDGFNRLDQGVSQQLPANPLGRHPTDPKQMTATAIYSDGSTRDVTALAAWTSGAPGVASVADGVPGRGRVTAVASGNAVIRADLDGLARTASVTVP